MVETVIIATLGAAWGSFLNVVIFRLPRRLSLAAPPSACPHCGKRIKPWNNIPVLSWLLLGGRCRDCRARIPFSYFLVEVLTPAALLVLHSRFGLSPHFFAGALFTSLLIALGFIDFYHQILPDALTLPGAGMALAYAFVRKDLSPPQSLLGAAVGAGILLLIYGIYYLVRRKEGLGLGDVTMMTLVGAFLGWQGAFFTLILASFLGALVGVFVILFRKKDLQFALPFGTFLAPAAFVAMVWGARIINAYLGLWRS